MDAEWGLMTIEYANVLNKRRDLLLASEKADARAKENR